MTSRRSHCKRNHDALRIRTLVYRLEVVDFECPADLIAGNVFEGVERQQLMLTRPPRLAWREHPSHLRVFNADIAD